MQNRKIERTDYVNEQIYDNLLIAKEHFDFLLNGQKASEKMMKCGTDLEYYEAEFIDQNVEEIYKYISIYVDSYENEEFTKCALIGKFLDDIKLDKEYLYRVLIRNKLSLKFQGDISYDDFGNYMNADMEIILKDGKRIHIIGKKDFITEMDYNHDVSSKVINQSKWIAKIPKTLLNCYSVVKDSKGKDENVCYVWNETLVSEFVEREWKSLKLDAALGYGVKEARIATDDHTYFFEDQDGNVLGELDYIDKQIAIKTIYIGDVLLTSKGDVEKLDDYLSGMYRKNEQKYIKKNS